MKTKLFTIFTTILIFESISVGAMDYTITDLGRADGHYSMAYGLNNYGHVVGNISYTTYYRGFSWNNGEMTVLDTLGGNNSVALDVNDNNQIIGYSDMPNYINKAFIYDEISGMINLGALGDGDVFSVACDINNDGKVVGKSEISTGKTHAFLWEEGLMKDIGTIEGMDMSVAYGVNNDSKIVGNSYNFSGIYQPHAFFWKNNEMRDIGMLDGHVSSEAYDINQNDQVVGWCQSASGNQSAFIWENDNFTDLGNLGGVHTKAFAINDYSQVVGLSRTSVGDIHSFLWEDGSIIDLNNLIPSDSGWVLGRAEDINNYGQIAGWGVVNGEEHAYLITPVPEPATILLFSLVGGFLRKQRK